VRSFGDTAVSRFFYFTGLIETVVGIVLFKADFGGHDADNQFKLGIWDYLIL